MLLVVLDTTRADALSLYGNPRPTSPRLDAFAKRAVVFENAFTVAPSTPPAMAALMTGRLPHYDRRLRWNDQVAHGMLRFFPNGKGRGLPPSLPTLAARFERGGYRTAAVVTNLYVKSLYGFDRGFDHYQEIFRDDVHVYGLATQVVDAALEILDDDSEEPFFLYRHFMDPHDPYLPPVSHREAIAFEPVPDLDDRQLNRRWVHAPYNESAERIVEMTEHARGLYDASVRYMDDELGRLLDAFAAGRSMDRTLIAIVGDHGEEFFEHGSNRHRGTVYDELLRVPLLVRLPGVHPRQVKGLVRHFDAGATLLDFAGLEPLPGTDAMSLRPFLDERGEAPALSVVGSFPVLSHGMPHRFFVRVSRYKLIYDSRVPSRSELYDLAVDPEERTNVYADRMDLGSHLRTKIEAAMDPLEAEWGAVWKPRRRALMLSDFGSLQLTDGSRIAIEPLGSAELRADGDASAGIELPTLLFVEPARIRVLLETESTAPATIRVLWQEPEDAEWRPWRSVAARTAPGRQTPHVEIEPPAGLVGPLRIEFGPTPLRLFRLEVLDLSAPESADAAPPADPAPIEATTLEQLRALGYAESGPAPIEGEARPR